MTTLHLRTAISRSPLRCGLLFIPLALACFALPPTARALLPAPTPDGGYPGSNTAEGTNALFQLTSGTKNTAIGSGALHNNQSGVENTAIGTGALFFNNGGSPTGGNGNTATGNQALNKNTTGNFNTANGDAALFKNIDGTYNTATGFLALNSNTHGMGNTATGDSALFSNRSGSENTANGDQALQNTTGSDNIALGAFAGFNLTTGNNNIDIGDNGVAGEANTIRIGIEGTQTATFIAGIDGVNEGGTISTVYINSNGRLGTQAPPSSRRFKKEIKPMDKASESILALKPVTFQYRSDSNATPQFGLIAEEVAEVNPNLVVRDQNGEIYTVRYEAVNAMLLNEFLKEHRKVENLKKDFQATVAQQQKEIAALTATMREQAAQIQKVSAQLESSKPAPQVVNNP